ncbi:MAG: family 16 glycosylhydrolase [Lachnospiraceae bacterium]|nr:family 16 glycosylhydrolase [Lachnospiraceae bacterium]
MKKQITKFAGVSLLALSLAVSPLSLTGVAAAPDPTNAYAQAHGYTYENLVWSDEFDGNELDQNTWNYEIGNRNGWGNNEKEYYTNSKSNVFITDISKDATSKSTDGKALAIRAQREEKEGYSYTSGRIQTSGKQAFKYGRMEACIKFENGMQKGVWPAFWMLGDNEPLGWPSCGEIDIMEHANTATSVISTLHWNRNASNPYSEGNQGSGFPIPGGTIDDWHVYAVEWDREKMTFYIDDKQIVKVPIQSTANDEFNGHNFYFILNVAIGGSFIQGAVPTSTWTSSTMFVDYIRVYQNKEIQPGATYAGTWNKSSIWNNIDKPNTEVKYYSDNNVVGSETVKKGDLLKAPEVTKAGYTFGGWVKSDNTPFDFTQSTKEDTLDLYAKWDAVTCAKPAIKSLKSKKKKTAVITFKSSDKYAGYELKYGLNKKVTKKAKTKKNLTKTKITVKSLKSKKIYYFKVRGYKLDSTGQKIYSAWSKVKKIKVK